MFKYFLCGLFLGIHSYSDSVQSTAEAQTYINKKVFCDVEFADHSHMLLESKTLSIPGVLYPFNSSIVRFKGRIFLAFRYDIKYGRPKFRSPVQNFPFASHIGIVELDEDFEVIANTFCEVKTGSEHSEDPRLFVFNEKLFVTYNDVVPGFPRQRAIYLAELNEDFQVEYITCFDLQLKPIEKNWVPIVHSSMGQENLFFGYSILPHRVYQVVDTKSPDLIDFFSGKDRYPYDAYWWMWGDLRGGTPPMDMGDHYLGFFHSFFQTENEEIKFWYVMGAYTFEKDFPFKVTRMSKEPIIFNSLYDTKIASRTADKSKRVAYPSSFLKGKSFDREVLFVSIGENDCAIKILVIDAEKLYESLFDVE